MTTLERCTELKGLIETHAPQLLPAANEFIDKHMAACRVLQGFWSGRPSIMGIMLETAHASLEADLCNLLVPLGLAVSLDDVADDQVQPGVDRREDATHDGA